MVSKAAINGDDKTITVKVSDDTDLSALAPNISVCPGASISPASGVAQDFSKDVLYTITSENGQKLQDWTVKALTSGEESEQQNDYLNLDASSSLTPVVNVYPNPAPELVNIDLHSISAETSVTVFNISGMKVYEENLISDKSIQIHGLTRGMYCVEVSNNISKTLVKLLVE